MKFNGPEISSGDINVLCGLLDSVREFSDEMYQQRVWIRGEGNDVTSYSEAMVDVLEDRRIFDFTTTDLGRYYGLNDEQIKALRTFGLALDDFNERLGGAVQNDARIIALPRFGEIRRLAMLARRQCEDWFSENCDCRSTVRHRK